MQRLFLITFIFLFKVSFGQTDFKKEMKIFSFDSPKYGKVEFCTFISTIEKKKPLLIFIHGSGNEPTFAYHKDLKEYSWAAFREIGKYKDKFHVIFVNKPGVPLFDTVQKDPVNFSTSYPKSKEFSDKYSLEWRAETASLIIEKALTVLPVDNSKIIVLGHSQGGQVAPKIAVLNKKVTHCVMLNCNSLNHLYDFVMQERLASLKGEKTFEESQRNIDSLYANYKRIFAEPNSRTKYFDEETYYRWASFSDETPLENMLKLKIPIYLVAGGKDILGSFIMNTDYAEIEFLRYGKTNLTYKVYPNANHFLQDEIIQNGKTKFVNRKPEIFVNIVDWCER
jgi:pimeloyl-ACP methyl ester carboxylesterase